MYQIKQLSNATLTNAAAVYYTVGTGINTRIGAFTLTNTDTNPHTISVYFVTGSGAPGTGDFILRNKTLQANESYVVYQALGQVLPAGKTIQMVADANSVVNAFIGGTEFTT